MKDERIIRGNSTMVGICIVLATVLIAEIGGSGSALAASFLNSCTLYCHGMPPRDGVRTGNPHFNSQSSAFTGNHRSHLPTAPAAAACSICHQPVAPADFGHQNGVIAMANSLKGYSSATLRARYDKGVFFNQTSVPNLTNATCSNVSCHFEARTPRWGTAPFVAPANCNACHGAPPAGTSAAPAGGLAGSHARHDTYFPGSSGCQKCHPAYTGFTHATSAGRPLRVQGFLRDPRNILETGAVYSGSGSNYLPSRSAAQVFGSCSNLYCHSSGQSATGQGAGTTLTTGNWGGPPLNCGSCHQNMGPGVNANATGKHSKHAQSAGIACAVCHGAGYTSSSVPTGSGATHVDRNINLAWTGIAAAPATTYSKGNTFAAGSAVYGSCSNSYCHSTVQNATTGLAGATYRTVSWAAATTLTCAGCHADMATDAIGSGSHRVHTIATGANLDCAVCHAGYTRTVTVPARHGNGQIDLGAAGFTYSQGAAHAAGTGYGTCSASTCHGQGVVTWGATYVAPGNTFPFSTSQCDKCHAGSATAPFYATASPKVTAVTDAKVGTHTPHLAATKSLAAAFACADCHGTVTLVSTTHMNGSTNFSWSALARTGGLTPSYTAGQCANTYCHGARMPAGDISGTNRTPTWNAPFLPATLTAASCGACHGFPPPVASGHPVATIPAGFPGTAPIGGSCSCHANINKAGNSYANIFVSKSLHINGTLDIITSGSCDACHGYPPAARGFAGTRANWSSARIEDYAGGGGAHTITNHVNRLARPADGFANCSKCHDQNDHQTSPIVYNPSQNIKVRVNQRYRLAAMPAGYTSNRRDGAAHRTGTCSNISCHFGATPKWDPNN